MKLLVTGGAGFIGSNFIRYILETYPNYEITNLDKLTYAGDVSTMSDFAENARFTFVKGDICDETLVDELVKPVDAVVHFAAETQNDVVNTNPKVAIDTNIHGTHTLLEAAHRNGNKRFHHVSTDEVFGHLEGIGGAFHEETPLNPRSFYPASKAASDFWVHVYGITRGLPVTISNCSNNYGPFQQMANVIPLFITNLLEGKKVPVYGDGSNIRDWLFVNDHCRAIDVILKRGSHGHRYCIGGGYEISNLDLTRMMLRILGLDESYIQFVEDRPGHDWRYAIDNQKVASLGWQPAAEFETSFRETVQWYRDNESWWRPLRERHQAAMQGRR